MVGPPTTAVWTPGVSATGSRSVPSHLQTCTSVASSTGLAEKTTRRRWSPTRYAPGGRPASPRRRPRESAGTVRDRRRARRRRRRAAAARRAPARPPRRRSRVRAGRRTSVDPSPSRREHHDPTWSRDCTCTRPGRDQPTRCEIREDVAVPLDGDEQPVEADDVERDVGVRRAGRGIRTVVAARSGSAGSAIHRRLQRCGPDTREASPSGLHQ